ncbi:MAG: hypothetical protein HUU03_06585 [Planctomycetaceae bacterium]|nr:hypothetical protein [Planctomycetaceae bacterium]
MRELCGLMLTWTTYGTWLHGDERGAYNRKGDTLKSHYVAPDPRLEDLHRRRMKDNAFILDAAMRKVVRLAIEECWNVSEEVHLELKLARVHAGPPFLEVGDGGEGRD